MTRTSVTYVFALDPTNTLIHICEAKRNVKYKCPGCKGKVVPVKGEVRADHFRHDNATCSYESYLHNAAKNAFYNGFNVAKDNAKPVRLQLTRQVICSTPKMMFIKNRSNCSSTIDANYNLTDLFDLAELEKYDDNTGLIPDVLLSNTDTNKQCYFEVCVTHACSQSKIDFGVTIIEIHVSCEEDVQFIKGLDFSVYDPKLTLHNFNVTPLKKDMSAGPCPHGGDEFEVWTLSQSGRLNKSVRLFRDLSFDDLNSNNCWSTETDEKEKYELIKQVALSQDPKNIYPNCLKCTYSNSWSDGQVYCLVKSCQLSYGEAKRCKDYQVVR